MKRRSFVCTLVTMLLLLATLFSITFAIAPHQDSCEHTACESCQEIQMAEQAIFEITKAREACAETACESCLSLEKQLVVLQEMKSAEHDCHEIICYTCIRTAIGERLRVLAALLAVFALVYAAYCATRYVVYEKKGLCQTSSLLSLKVRLNN